jgi:hypothetical protein
MFRIDNADIAGSLPAVPSAGTEGFFTEGNPGTSTPATPVEAWWFNMITEELRKLVVDAGLTPAKADFTQVSTAVQALIAAAISAQSLGTAAYRNIGLSATNVPEVLSATGKLDPSIIPTQSVEALRKLILVNSMKDAMLAANPQRIVNALVDPFADTSQIDTGASSGYEHNAAGDYLENPGITITPSAGGLYSGAVADFTFVGDDVTISPATDRGIWTTGTFGPGTEVTWTWSANDGWVAFLDATASGSFNQNTGIQTAATSGKTWTVRWYPTAGDLRVYDYGNSSNLVSGYTANYAVSPIGQPCKLKMAEDGTVTFEVNGAVVHTFAGSGTGKTVHFQIGAGNGSIDLDDISFTETGDPENYVIVSEAIEATLEPTLGYFSGIVQPVDSITLNTDVLVDLSLDDGASWEAVTVEQVGETIDGYWEIYGDLEFAGSGDQTIRYRLRGANNKSVRWHAAIMDVEA